jgi:hypothetical protein
MPAWILWLSPVIVSPLAAIAWTSWSSRDRGPEQAIETVEQHDRFRAAFGATGMVEQRTVRPAHHPRQRASR